MSDYNDEQGGDHYSGQGASAERGCGEMIVLAIAVIAAVVIIAAVAANSMPR